MSLSIGCTDWHSGDIKIADTDKGRKYVIYLFGRTAKSSLVTLVVTGFRPCGYIEVPMDCSLTDTSVCQAFRDFFTQPDGEGLPYYAQKSLASIQVVRRNRFRGFDANTSRRYVKVECESRQAIRAVSRMFLRDIPRVDSDRKEQVPKAVFIPGITKGGKQVLPLNEFGIDPLLRFFHLRNIEPANWICVPKRALRKCPTKTRAKFTFYVDWNVIQPLATPPCEIPWVIASFDIECLSSHGDFPQPVKDFRKPARDLVELVDSLPRSQKRPLSRSQFRQFLHAWFLDSTDNPPIQVGVWNTQIDPVWHRIHGIFTKDDRTPSRGQIDALLDQLYPILFESSSDTRAFQIADRMKDVLEPRIQVAPDRIVQIGTSFWRYGEDAPYRHTMITLGDCAPIEGVEVSPCSTEAAVLQTWHKGMSEEMPDILTGYNIFGFDIPYLYKRAEDEGVLDRVFQLSRFHNFVSELKTKQVKGIGGALVQQEYVDTPGMVQMDLYKIIQRDHNLASYKLDNVAATFLRGKVKRIEADHRIQASSVAGLEPGNSISLRTTAGYVEETWGHPRYEVKHVDPETQTIHLCDSLGIDPDTIPDDLVWCMGKNDVSPKDIFRLCKGTAEDQRIVAKYCVQDVVLVIHLIRQLQMLSNNVAMGNVCSVPFGWIVSRGQGVKIQSLVAKQCAKRGFILPDLDKTSFGKETFEGAIVLPPVPGLYLEEPVAVLDYASLYPSSMISVNLSHESYCDQPEWQGDKGAERLRKLGYDWEDITYDTFTMTYTASGQVKDKVKSGEKTVRFVQEPTGIIPQILENLLAARKATRKRMKHKTIVFRVSDGTSDTVSGIANKTENGDWSVGDTVIPGSDVIEIQDTYSTFEKEVMDGQQLAYKITANSLYGQIGARTSYIYWKDIAAATTATGRKQLDIAQIYCEDKTNFPQTLEDGSTIYLNNQVVYGDTDSVFVKYDCRNPDGSKMTGKDALQRSIELGCHSEKGIQKRLKQPQRLEYEKTFWPFILFTKKRYVGDKYEFDPNKSKRTSMGIVLKRRDNAPIVKMLFGGVIDTIMETRQTKRALDELQRGLFDLIRGNYSMNHLIITKTLAPYYKKPETVAHRVLADRISERDPGNAPQVNDRIPYVHIKIKKKKTKVKPGENIENPEYVEENGLQIDYSHYISNQIMKPVSQIFALAPHMVPGSRVKEGWFESTWKGFERDGLDREEARKKAQNQSQKIIQHCLFDGIMITLKNSENRQREITDWF